MVKSSTDILAQVRRLTGAHRAKVIERIQSLWGGYGELLRVELTDGPVPQVVVKWVSPPNVKRSAKSCGDERSHARKLRSYAVEQRWYTAYAPHCGATCRVAKCLGTAKDGDASLFIFEDLDYAGFPRRVGTPNLAETHAVLRWLAAFHARHLGVAPEGLWKIGSYWHLATRPDELARMTNDRLRKAAPHLDARLNGCRFRTFVHGDAKIDNFCFTPMTAVEQYPSVAAVDFQYVGGGCGVKDVAYFFSSIWSPSACEAHAESSLRYYFEQLESQLALQQSACDPQAVEEEWRALYPVAWADFQRFLEGWALGQYDGDRYANSMINLALKGTT